VCHHEGYRVERFELTRDSAWSVIGLSALERIVIVMGPTGAGKSTFIEHATRLYGQTIGHRLQACTTDVRAVRVTHPADGYQVVLVDTPGFDSTNRSDEVVLAQIADFLTRNYHGGVHLASIIYLHKISDNRMTWSALKNLPVFGSLCGQVAAPPVILATTMWSHVPEGVGGKREEQLRVDVWKDMGFHGCKIHRFEETYESAWRIIDGRDQTSSRFKFQPER